MTIRCRSKVTEQAVQQPDTWLWLRELTPSYRACRPSGQPTHSLSTSVFENRDNWSANEARYTRSIVVHTCQPSARLQALSAINKDEAELISLKTALNDVCEHFQAALQSRKDVYRAVHALPKDVLLLIFQFAVLPEQTEDRKSTRLNSSHSGESRMPSSA